jgi:SpoVK/Ycf46/Vps4 family AAA+-type ATPase
MMFLGNPGTGKTTVARIIGRIFRQEGLLRKGHFIETTGNGLVIGNIQATMEHVRNLCRDSYGSILFIDEAYGMNIGHSSGNVADEILPTLVAEMENHRDDMCVILAGYKEEMEEFVKENSGLKSRIPHVLEFPNYTREELIEIFFKMIDGKFEYERELKDTVCEYFLNIPDENLNDREFSNARFVRNLYERLWGKAAYRISQSQDKRLLLKKEDMVCITEEEDFHTMVKEKNKKQIGFTFE